MTRSIKINEPDLLSSNSIQTTNYTLYNFVPKNLVHQFSRFANFYFLFLLILQLFPIFAVTSPFFAAFPLIVVVAASMFKDGLEDYQRYKSDNIQNNLFFEVFQHGLLPSKDIKSGHVLVIKEDQQIPADMIVLYTSETNGYSYIETKNLDGETNMKLRTAIYTSTIKLESIPTIEIPTQPLQVEEPINQIYSFSGSFNNKPLLLDHTLWRGCTLRHTDFVIGVVIYAGNETRIQLNSGAKSPKLSSIDQKTNPFVLGNLLLLFIMVFISSTGFVVVEGSDPWSIPDFNQPNTNKYFEAFLHLFDGLLIFQNIVPLSLFITIELIKGLHAWWIYSDKELKGNLPAMARTWTLGDELGLIDIIFTDKTGTLTENKMELQSCGIGRNSFNLPMTNNNLTNPFLPFMKDKEVQIFFTILLLCHTAVIEHKQDAHLYVSESPDEIALLSKSRQLGFIFDHRDGNLITLKMDGQLTNYTILHVIEFTSKRKRMSIIVQSHDNKLLLFTKGADDFMFNHAIPNPSLYASINDHLQHYAQCGLRTLCFSYRELNQQEYDIWHTAYKEAISTNNKELQSELNDKIEQNWHVVGCSGIEDKLQEYVPQAIKLFKEAGILVWVLTGDKLETAMSIGFSTCLLKAEMKVFVLRGKGDITVELEGYASQLSIDINLNALVIDGEALEIALSQLHVDLFLRFCARCVSVICCRVSPLQKASVVKLVREKQDVITLAIGDGANDVNMIQAAHVGVGIRGVEGMQAAMNADYVIDKFRFLVSLILVHGHWNYHRISWMILCFFQKNVIWVGVLFWFQFHSYFSYVYVWDFSFMMMFNVLFTALPVAAIGGWDQTINRHVLLSVPSLYKCSQSNHIYTYNNFILVMFVGLYQSIICFYVPFLAYYDIVLDGGRTVDLLTVGTTMAICAVFNANLYCLLCSKYWTIIHLVFVWGSTFTIFVYIVGASYVVASPLYGVVNTTLGSFIFWFTMIMATALCQLPWLFYEYSRRTYFGTDIEVFQQMHRDGGLRILTSPQELGKEGGSTLLRSPLPQMIASPMPVSVLERNASKYGLQPLMGNRHSEIMELNGPISPINGINRESILSDQSSLIGLHGEQIHGGFAFSKEDGVGRAISIIKSPEKRHLDRRHTISVVRDQKRLLEHRQHKRSKSNE